MRDSLTRSWTLMRDSLTRSSWNILLPAAPFYSDGFWSFGINQFDPFVYQLYAKSISFSAQPYSLYGSDKQYKYSRNGL
jgi:hypothetical protein